MESKYKVIDGIESLTYWIIEKRYNYFAIDEYDFYKKKCLGTVVTRIPKQRAELITTKHNNTTNFTYSQLIK